MKGKQLYLFGLKQSGLKDQAEKQKFKPPLDILIIVGVVFALSLIISFSLGVEKGKRMVSTTNLDLASDKQPQQPEDEPRGKEEESLLEEKVGQTEIVTNEQKYKIQVASFHKENTARKAAEQLQEKGYPTSITRKGKYVVIYVGEFDDEKEAKSNFELLREKYKDCILRRL